MNLVLIDNIYFFGKVFLIPLICGILVLFTLSRSFDGRRALRSSFLGMSSVVITLLILYCACTPIAEVMRKFKPMTLEDAVVMLIGYSPSIIAVSYSIIFLFHYRNKLSGVTRLPNKILSYACLVLSVFAILNIIILWQMNSLLDRTRFYSGASPEELEKISKNFLTRHSDLLRQSLNSHKDSSLSVYHNLLAIDDENVLIGIAKHGMTPPLIIEQLRSSKYEKVREVANSSRYSR